MEVVELALDGRELLTEEELFLLLRERLVDGLCDALRYFGDRGLLDEDRRCSP